VFKSSIKTFRFYNTLSLSNFPPRQPGFTLIELLVVLVVMGVVLGLAMVQLMPDKDASLRDEGLRLALLLENAGMEARASGRPLAWSGEKNNYRFLRKNNYGDWIRIDDDSLFRPRAMTEGVNLGEIKVEGQSLKSGELLLLSAHSYAAPFIIRLRGEVSSATVTARSTGDVIFTLDGRQSESVGK
jgi:general secretion pathway protein H